MAFTHGASDLFGLADADFVQQSHGDNTTRDHSIVEDDKGDFIADSDAEYNKRDEVSVTYAAKNLEGPAQPKEIVMGGDGQGSGGFVITQIAVTQESTKEATIVVTGHKHDADNTHLTREYTVALPLLSAHGILESPLKAALPTNIQKFTWTASLGHIDKGDNRGDHLIGVSTGLRIECTEDYVDNAEVHTLQAPWVLDDEDVKGDKRDLQTKSLKAHMVQVADA